ncbi:MAG: tetraacyldisaccharide 4'-kinase [Desulfobacterota bacterium]|nr:tetraacyldisaccharide 4'-kinase [Thermodesulfobacteriota bacterium]
MINIRATIERVLHLNPCNPAMRFLLMPLTLCSVFYRFAIIARAHLYRRGMLPVQKLPCPVISVGNITVGGTGKTPTVCSLARWFHDQGIRIAVVTRGYRGKTTRRPIIASDGVRVGATVDEVGDEAVMLSTLLPGIPVIACRNRFAAGMLGVNRFGVDLIILDDGFQHLKLHRDVDIVLLHAIHPFGNGYLLPRGTLREPPSALDRATIILLTKKDGAQAELTRLKNTVASNNPNAPMFTSSFQITGLRNAHTGETIPLASCAHTPVAGFCSIGDPASFAGMLSRLSAHVVACIAFPDHHRYRPDDYRRINELFTRASLVITTQKDIAKLDLTMLQTGKLAVLDIELVIDDAEHFYTLVGTRTGLRTSCLRNDKEFTR